MKLLTVSRAKAGFSKVTRTVLKSRQPAIVRTPGGLVQIAPYDLPEYVPPAAPGSYKPTKQEIALSNTFGESL